MQVPTYLCTYYLRYRLLRVYICTAKVPTNIAHIHFILRALIANSFYSVCTLCTLTLFCVYSFHTHFILRVLFVHSFYAACTLCTITLFCVYSLNTHLILCLYSLHTHFILHLFLAHSFYSLCTLCTLLLFCVYSLDTHFIMQVCTFTSFTFYLKKSVRQYIFHCLKMTIYVLYKSVCVQHCILIPLHCFALPQNQSFCLINSIAVFEILLWQNILHNILINKMVVVQP